MIGIAVSLPGGLWYYKVYSVVSTCEILETYIKIEGVRFDDAALVACQRTR